MRGFRPIFFPTHPLKGGCKIKKSLQDKPENQQVDIDAHGKEKGREGGAVSDLSKGLGSLIVVAYLEAPFHPPRQIFRSGIRNQDLKNSTIREFVKATS